MASANLAYPDMCEEMLRQTLIKFYIVICHVVCDLWNSIFDVFGLKWVYPTSEEDLLHTWFKSFGGRKQAKSFEMCILLCSFILF